jgi:hypothetical protein
MFELLLAISSGFQNCERDFDMEGVTLGAPLAKDQGRTIN